MVGIAYSLGFLIGPLLGAGFARLIRLHPEMFFRTPALAGVILTAMNVFFVITCLRETLPKYKRVSKNGRISFSFRFSFIGIHNLVDTSFTIEPIST